MKLVKFWAPWCGPCKMLAPVLEKVLEEENIEYEEVNVDEDQESTVKYEVMSVPTVILVKDNVEIARFTGFRPEDAIKEFINENK